MENGSLFMLIGLRLLQNNNDSLPISKENKLGEDDSMKKLYMILPLVLILCFVVGCQDKEVMAELEEFRAQAALEEQNIALVRHMYEELNKGTAADLEAAKELAVPDYSHYYPSGNPKPVSFEEMWASLLPIFEAFPDFNWSIEDVFAAGDKVVVRIVFRGTHQGEFMGIPPTGKKVEVGGLNILRIENGKFVEDWEDADMLGWMMQLGMELKPKGEK